MTDNQPNFHIYSKPDCPYCEKAKALLDDIGADYEVLDVRDADNLTRLKTIHPQAHEVRKVPQVFVAENGRAVKHIGGYTELEMLIRAFRLLQSVKA